MIASVKYQVFVSSTYLDLREQRQAALHQLLDLGAIPQGMELFPSLSEDPLHHIRRAIDDSDVYVLIVGTRYGSVHRTLNKSFTELEYEYAESMRRLPIYVLTQTDGAEDPDGAESRLSSFRARVSQERAPGHWTTLQEFEREFFKCVTNALQNPTMPGWVRGGSHAPTISAPYVPDLAGLNDSFLILWEPAPGWNEAMPRKVTWRWIFLHVAPHIHGLTSESAVRFLITEDLWPDRATRDSRKGDMSDDQFFSIRAQLELLKLVSVIDHPDRLGRPTNWWQITPGGQDLERFEFAQRIPKGDGGS